MLKRDKEVFLSFVSGDEKKIQDALSELASRELGHFEEHPISARLVKEHLPALIDLWNSNSTAACKGWVLQFIADARISDPVVKPLIVRALGQPNSSILPTVLYLMGTQPSQFSDVGELLIPLTQHRDSSVRWRIAWFISKLQRPSPAMQAAIQALKGDAHGTTQDYVRQCLKRLEVQA